MIFGKVRSVVLELGFWNGVLYLLDAGLSRLSRGRWRLYKYYLVVQPVSATPLLPAHRGRNIVVRQIHRHDPEIGTFPRPARRIQWRFDQGGQCLAAYLDGALVGFLWFNPGPYQEDEVRCRFVPLPEGEAAWDYDVFVDPRQRLGLVFSRLWDEGNSLLRRQGFAWSASRISAFKPVSLTSHARMGGRRTGSACFLCGGRWQLLLASLPPYVHFSASPERCPVLRVAAPGRA
ncbi:MAG: N-acetyltransferase [Pseudomonadota bacterium]|nr:N-acetyltransferase [Pseudomonadota bacterium]